MVICLHCGLEMAEASSRCECDRFALTAAMRARHSSARPAPLPPSSFARVITIAAALASERIRRGDGPIAVTPDEMTLASSIVRSTVSS